MKEYQFHDPIYHIQLLLAMSPEKDKEKRGGARASDDHVDSDDDGGGGNFVAEARAEAERIRARRRAAGMTERPSAPRYCSTRCPTLSTIPLSVRPLNSLNSKNSFRTNVLKLDIVTPVTFVTHVSFVTHVTFVTCQKCDM